MAAVSQELSYDAVAKLAAQDTLIIMGGVQGDGGTLLLLGPGPAFWERFQTAPEHLDGRPDPIDRWSSRVIGALADRLQAEALFPFGGPPYQPFLSWAVESGRAWQSPLGMLVHDTAGLMVSYRGALRFAHQIDLPALPATPPCDSCLERPCTTACPVGALSDAHVYKTDDCHSHLSTPAGHSCMSGGCLARRACPVSQSFARDPAQSAHHMRYFHTS